MGFVSRLREKIATAIATGDVEELRVTLIDETDVAVDATANVRSWYMRLWERFSEYDYGHIDLARLLVDLQTLLQEGPRENVLVHSFTESGTSADEPVRLINASFQRSAGWPERDTAASESATSTTLAPVVPWALSSIS